MTHSTHTGTSFCEAKAMSFPNVQGHRGNHLPYSVSEPTQETSQLILSCEKNPMGAVTVLSHYIDGVISALGNREGE